MKMRGWVRWVLALANFAFAAHRVDAADYLKGFFVGNSPEPIAVSRSDAWKSAESVAARQPGSFVVRGDGSSMEPIYPSGTVLVIASTPFSQLKRGATVLYRNREGLPVTHLLIAQARGGWRAAGLNNKGYDSEAVRAENFIGVVTHAFLPADLPPASALSYAAR